MNYRRYYPKGSKNRYVVSDDQFDDMIEKLGFELAVERDNAQIELIPESEKEAVELFLDGCNRVRNDTNFYMQNLDKIPTFQMRKSSFYRFLEENMPENGPKPKTL